MAITKRIEEDKIEVVGAYKTVQVRTATILEENGVEISRSFHRHTVAPNISASDLANESTEVQGICSTVHTQAVKDAYAAHLTEQETL